MKLYARLLWLLLTAWRRDRTSWRGPCITPMRVWPQDLDIYRHVNNGVYLTLMDLGRTDLMLRAGVVRQVMRLGQYPVVAAEAIRFRRSLELFDRYELHTEVSFWDERAIYLRQRFVRRGELVAEGLVEARMLQRGGGRVDVFELLTRIGEDPTPPARPDWLDQWQLVSRELANDTSLHPSRQD